jgi:hypothetical protein
MGRGNVCVGSDVGLGALSMRRGQALWNEGLASMLQGVLAMPTNRSRQRRFAGGTAANSSSGSLGRSTPCRRGEETGVLVWAEQQTLICQRSRSRDSPLFGRQHQLRYGPLPTYLVSNNYEVELHIGAP